ncbi:ionotropic receptor 75a [Scaptodrosophila lebanonensis]|uniref:Ionotropic receptor 75a n=1 Tax=Drosophila lebanonensis TaxID=7225 RepID=A0A6J2U9W0_DROLE|nr:ionotropic receptor 75a [Scaptodrosophila lebanonensis]
MTMDSSVIINFTTHLVKSHDAIIFDCNAKELQSIAGALMAQNQFVYPVQLNSSFNLRFILTRHNYAHSSIVINTSCKESSILLEKATRDRYFNKTYQWLVWGVNQRIDNLFPPEINYIGPNAQVTFVNESNGVYMLWDIHSKGRHLKSKLEIRLIAKIDRNSEQLQQIRNIFELQSIRNRDQFNGLTLRGASVIDQENITTNEQITAILSRPSKDSGVAAFIKYHYELLGLLQERFNFSVRFRNSRGWAGRLGNTTFRLGLLGIIMRNEADVAASGSFNRINRFAEFDTIHQSWKFETAFLYRFTPDLNTDGKSGNFLAPFRKEVWYIGLGTLIVVVIMWFLIKVIKSRSLKMDSQNLFFENENEPSVSKYISPHNYSELILQTLGAVCQQGMDPMYNNLPSRCIVLTIFLFSLVMYNYYTSSVVGGLLSSSGQGPASVDEITLSTLKISFEDIGYYKVLFRESKNPIVTRLISRKLSASRGPQEVPIYSHIDEAVPYLKKGGFAFHCEVVDAYPKIANLFDANEICDLRQVSGLMEVEIMNWIVHKNSQYTEIFKIAMCTAREAGLVQRILRQRQIKKPVCQSLYTVYPVSLSGVMSAFVILIGNFLE